MEVYNALNPHGAEAPAYCAGLTHLKSKIEGGEIDFGEIIQELDSVHKDFSNFLYGQSWDSIVHQSAERDCSVLMMTCISTPVGEGWALPYPTTDMTKTRLIRFREGLDAMCRISRVATSAVTAPTSSSAAAPSRRQRPLPLRPLPSPPTSQHDAPSLLDLTKMKDREEIDVSGKTMRNWPESVWVSHSDSILVNQGGRKYRELRSGCISVSRLLILFPCRLSLACPQDVTRHRGGMNPAQRCILSNPGRAVSIATR